MARGKLLDPTKFGAVEDCSSRLDPRIAYIGAFQVNDFDLTSIYECLSFQARAQNRGVQHLAFPQNSLADHDGLTPLVPRRSQQLADWRTMPARMYASPNRQKNPLPYLRERLLRRVMRCFKASAFMFCLAAISATAAS